MIKSMRPHIYAVATLLFFFLVSTPALASTQTMSYAEGKVHAQLLLQIKSLLAEVVRLQELLAKQNTRALSSAYVPYETVIFPLPFERIYEVDNGVLKSIGSGSDVRVVDRELFDLFKSTVGEKAVKENLKEWRVFKNDNSDLGAFVELIAGTDEWVVGVNRENFDSTDPQLTRAFANLFVHEYAHILLFEETAFERAYTQQFWTAEDARHSVRVAGASDQFSVLSRYYDLNRARFVSDYATLSPEEDMAETFVAFVREGKPTGTTIRDKKINQFYTSAFFVKERTLLRANLVALGAL